MRHRHTFTIFGIVTILALAVFTIWFAAYTYVPAGEYKPPCRTVGHLEVPCEN